MNRGRNLGLAVLLTSGLAFAMVGTAPAAFAAGVPVGPAVQASADLQRTAPQDDPPRGDYARGYDAGRQQGVKDGRHDADVDCQEHKKMSARGGGPGEYQRGWEAGYNAGYEFGYNEVYEKECKADGVKKSVGTGQAGNGKKSESHKSESHK